MPYPSSGYLSTQFLYKSLFCPLLGGVLFLVMSDDTIAQNSPVIRQKIEANWQFRQAESGTWKPAAVPGSVHTALLNNQMIEDPFYRDNEEKLQWIEKADWEYEGIFEVEEALLQKKHLEITFRGLDTYTHVYLNDSLVLETDNMFRTWTADVKKWLKPGTNKLHVYFESPVKKVETEWKNLGDELPGGIRTMTRKAQFH
jgi:beta-mannosidase